MPSEFQYDIFVIMEKYDVMFDLFDVLLSGFKVINIGSNIGIIRESDVTDIIRRFMTFVLLRSDML